MGNEHNINREQNMLAVLQAEPTEENLWMRYVFFRELFLRHTRD